MKTFIRRTLLTITVLASLILLENLSAYFMLRTQISAATGRELRTDLRENPYLNAHFQWKKTAFHLHSSAPGPQYFERPSPEEIVRVYKKHGYDLSIITDYHHSGNTTGTVPLDAFEWGRNFRKRHFVVVGSHTVFPDPFPLFWQPSNLEWIINHWSREGAYVVAAHPTLYFGLSESMLRNVSGLDAVEVFSPNVDSDDNLAHYWKPGNRVIPEELIQGAGQVPLWDRILTSGHRLLPVSSVDLHHFPPEESVSSSQASILYRRMMGKHGNPFTNYMLVNTSGEAADILAALKEGRYVCVKSMLGETQMTPALRYIGREGNTIQVAFSAPDKFASIALVGEGGQVLQRVENQERASFLWPPDQRYVRIQALTAGLTIILSSPFMRSTDLANSTRKN